MKKTPMIMTVLTAAALLLTGCASGSTSASPAGQAFKAALSPSDHPDPQAMAKADSFLAANGPAEQGRQVVIEQCMRKAGFTWVRQQAKPGRVEDLMTAKPLTVAQARADAYSGVGPRSTEAVGGTQGPDAQAAFMGSPSDPKITVHLFGTNPSVSSRGCLAESYKTIYGLVENGMMATGIAVNALQPSVNAALFDDAMTALNKKWSQCFAAAGNPGLPSPGNAVIESLKTPAVAAKYSIDDAKCRETLGYDKGAATEINRYLTSFLAANEGQITQIETIRQDASKRATTVLAGS